MGIQFTQERRESARDQDASSLGWSISIVTVPAWGVNNPVLLLLVTPFCHAQVLQRGLLGAPGRDIWGSLFLEKLLLETQ